MPQVTPSAISSEDVDRESAVRRVLAGEDLNAVAITDHHDFLFAPLIRRVALDEYELLNNRSENADLIATRVLDGQRLVERSWQAMLAKAFRGDLVPGDTA